MPPKPRQYVEQRKKLAFAKAMKRQEQRQMQPPQPEGFFDKWKKIGRTMMPKER